MEIASTRFSASLGIFFSTLCGLVIFHWPYLTGEHLYFHDSVPHLTAIGLAYRSLALGRLPLWDPYMNGGEPLWPLVETVAAFDPVVLILWPLQHLMDVSWAVAYQRVAIVWLWLFSFGAALCAKRLSSSPWVQSTVFLLCFAGPIAACVPSQSHGFLVPFRYFPFWILALEYFLEHKNWRTAVLLGFAIVLGLSGYQSIYAAFLFCVFALFYVPAVDWVRHRRLWLVVGGVIAAGSVAPFLGGLEALQLYPAGRAFFLNKYVHHAAEFFRGIIGGARAPSPDHGSSYLGVAPLMGILIAVAGSAWKWRTLPRFAKAWLVLTGVALFVSLGGLGPATDRWHHFLWVRNWGFCLSIAILGLVLLCALGAEFCLQSRIFQWLQKHGGKRSLFFGGLILFSTVLWESHRLLSSASTVPRSSALEKIQPRFSRSEPSVSLETRRVWPWDSLPYRPYHYQGPSVRQHFAAFTEPLVRKLPPWLPVKAMTPVGHQFRTQRYQSLVSADIPLPLLKEILGVSLPWLRFARQLETVPSQEVALERLRTLQSLNRADVVEGWDRSVSVTKGDIKIKHYDPQAVRLQVKADSSAFLVFSEGYDPHWRVRVDGQSEKVWPVNVVNKGVWIPSGDHEVQFFYQPTGYIWAFWWRFLYLSAGLVFVLGYWKRLHFHRWA